MIHGINQDDLVQDEKVFFEELSKYENQLGFSFSANRSSKYAPFNVYLNPCGYVGKIRLYIDPPKFAVKEKGKERAKRVFTTLKEAQEYSNNCQNMIIEQRDSKDERFMQIQYGIFEKPNVDLNMSVSEYLDTTKDNLLNSFKNVEIVEGVDFEVYISKIPLWIDFCKNVLIPNYQWIVSGN